MMLDLRTEPGLFACGPEQHVEAAVVRRFADPLLGVQVGQVDLTAGPARHRERMVGRHHDVRGFRLHDRAGLDPGRQPQLEARELAQ
jgi:hypothetical protein